MTEQNGLNTALTLKPASKSFVKRHLSKQNRRLLKTLQWRAWRTEDSKVMGIFFGSPQGLIWEGHWYSSATARETLTACREIIKLFFKETQAKRLFGYTDCRNKSALKLVRLLGFIPQDFIDVQGTLCLLTVKENSWE